MKNFKLSNELLKAAENVFLCKAFTDSIRPIVEGYQKELIEKYKFKVAPEWIERGKRRGFKEDEYITDINFTYLMSDSDSKIYFDELQKKHIENGFKYLIERENENWREMYYCPLLISEDNERKARRELLKAAQYITKIDPSKIWKVKTLEKLEELTLKLCAPFIDSNKVMNDILVK